MAARIWNRGLESLPLPYPFKGILPPGSATVVNSTASAVLAALGNIGQSSTVKVDDVPNPGTYDTFRINVLNQGGYLAGDDLASNALNKGASLVGIQDAAGRIAGTNLETASAEIAGRILPAVADNTALAAIPAATRANGSICITLDADVRWVFDAASVAGASDWVVVPAAGTGRWLRTTYSVAELSSVLTGYGASLIGIEDAAGRIAGTNLETASAEIAGRILPAVADNAALSAIPAAARVDGSICITLDADVRWVFDAASVAGASDWVVVPVAGAGRWLRTTYSVAELSSVLTGYGASLIGIEDAAGRIAGTNLETASAEIAGRILPAVADNAALAAIAEATRVDGSICITLDADVRWVFDGASVAGASDWVVVPAAGAGRWLRTTYSVAEVSSVLTGYGASLIGIEDAAGRIAGTNLETASAEIAGRILPAVADNAALSAIPAAARVDGSICITLDADVRWVFDGASVAGASDWVVVPAAGAGRWLRTTYSVAELSSVLTGYGASLIGIEDAADIIVGTDLESATQEFATDLNLHRPGKPQQNRLQMLGAPGAILEGDTVTIGADVYEFRSTTPPAGGTLGRIWVYNGANSAASRANFIDAVNGVVDAARITRDGTNTELVVAAEGIALGDVQILSADAIGGSPAPSAVTIAVAEGLTTPTDIWDANDTYGGIDQAHTQSQMVTITLSAAMIAKGSIEAFYSFDPVSAIVVNRSRPQDELFTIANNYVSLTLAGGAGPNNQAGDIIDIIAFG